jgi:hypothetical protein
MMLAAGLSYIAFIMLRYFPSIPSFLRAFVMKWYWILSKAFSASIQHICICWITPAFLGWSWLGCGEWSFWCVVEFSLPLFYYFCIDVH